MRILGIRQQHDDILGDVDLTPSWEQCVYNNMQLNEYVEPLEDSFGEDKSEGEGVKPAEEVADLAEDPEPGKAEPKVRDARDSDYYNNRMVQCKSLAYAHSIIMNYGAANFVSVFIEKQIENVCSRNEIRSWKMWGRQLLFFMVTSFALVGYWHPWPTHAPRHQWLII